MNAKDDLIQVIAIVTITALGGALSTHKEMPHVQLDVQVPLTGEVRPVVTTGITTADPREEPILVEGLRVGR